MPNEISNAFRDIGRTIRFNLDNNMITATVILIYSAIDAMAILLMSKDRREVHRKDFIEWVEGYMADL